MSARYGVAEWYGRPFINLSIWLIPELIHDAEGRYRLSPGHWEVLTLEDTHKKLLAAETIRREAFERDLQNKLEPFG